MTNNTIKQIYTKVYIYIYKYIYPSDWGRLQQTTEDCGGFAHDEGGEKDYENERERERGRRERMGAFF